MLAPLWTQGADETNHEGGDPNIWTWPSTATGNAQTSWVPLVTMDAVIPAGSGFLMSVFDHNDFDNQNADPDADWPKTITDRKSTRLNSSHVAISYAVFC